MDINPKKIIVILCAIIFNYQLNSQNENSVVVSADKLNILYIGIDNPVSIAAPGILSDKLKVIINNGTISGSNGKYIVQPVSGSESIIEVSAEVKPGELKKVDSVVFKNKRIPDPSPCIGNNCNTSLYITKEELLKNTNLSVALNLPFDFKYEIMSFVFSYIGENKNKVDVAVTGNKFTQDIINSINKMNDGSELSIENIKVKFSDGSVRNLSPIEIKLKVKNI
jgi:gliding motility-associated protein GldM